MAICLINKGGGGVQSEDVTALRSEVLAGKTALTADSNDEAIQGTMPLLSPNSDMPHVMMCFDRGVGDFWGKGGAIDSPLHGRGVIVSMRPEDLKKYALDDRAVFVYMPVPDLRPENIRSDKNIAKVQGSIPIWDIRSSGWGDVLYAWADQGHVWDHPIVGRGICSKVPNGHIIEGANWVFLKAPTILPENLRSGTSVLNINGTLVDYGAGGVAFNGATFDNRLMSGVAFKDKEVRLGEFKFSQGNIGFASDKYFTNQNDNSFKYLGIKDGGLRFSLVKRTKEFTTGRHNRNIAVFFNRSVNLTPFKKIKIGGKFLSGLFHNAGGNADNPDSHMGIALVPIGSVIKSTQRDFYDNYEYYNYGIKYEPAPILKHVTLSISHLTTHLFGQQLWAETDISNAQGHYFIFAYAQASARHSGSSARAESIINHIEFIN